MIVLPHYEQRLHCVVRLEPVAAVDYWSCKSKEDEDGPSIGYCVRCAQMVASSLNTGMSNVTTKVPVELRNCTLSEIVRSDQPGILRVSPLGVPNDVAERSGEGAIADG